nr:hypothetical protein Iba_scaffold29795CG0010 [Ipomoea batatas]GMC74895.1 hypothetical protein Iba_scaffold34217CG0030 [Ipomoea batatas]GMC92047.1 hypothetical protein Iba_scaffold64842CG0010 [Ipomoea batatas]
MSCFRKFVLPKLFPYFQEVQLSLQQLQLQILRHLEIHPYVAGWYGQTLNMLGLSKKNALHSHSLQYRLYQNICPASSHLSLSHLSFSL